MHLGRCLATRRSSLLPSSTTIFLLCLLWDLGESFTVSLAHLRTACSGHARTNRPSGIRMSSSQEDERVVRNLLQLCASTNRGQSASLDQRYDIENAIADLECSNPTEAPSSSTWLNGEWDLVYASEAMTRTSPFFWGFRKAVDGMVQPLPLLPAELSEALFAITDGLPFASVGPVLQVISGAGTNTTGVLRSSVEVSIRVFDALVPPQVGYITTTSNFDVESPTSLVLTVQDTRIERSTWSQLPVIGSFVESTKFPTRDVFERVKQGSSRVTMELTYLTDDLRISRNENDQVFVFCKSSPGAEGFD